MENFEFIIIIPTYNQEVLLEKTLSSLKNCEFDKNNFKVMVVENGSKGEIEGLVKKYSEILNIEYLYEEIGNKSNALNKVLSLVNDSFVILFDDDIRIGENVLSEYSSAFSKFGPGHFWGGSVCPDFEGSGPPDYLIDLFPNSVKGLHLAGKDTEIFTPDLLGCNWAFYSEDIRDVGLFDVSYGPGSVTGSVGQETQAMMKLLNAGVSAIYLPNATVWHYVPRVRSSFAWLKNRKYKIGIRAGLITRDEKTSSKNFFGVPFWFAKNFISSFFNYFFKRHLIFDKKIRANYVLDFCKNKGMLKGLLTKD